MVSRHVRPAALLLDHPVFPAARDDGGALVPDVRGSVPIASLSRRHREGLAAQLVAAAAVAAEMDLWPGAGAIRAARAVRRRGVYWAVLPRFAVPMTSVLRRLGGGESALETVRGAAERAISEATGVELAGEGTAPGFYLEGPLRQALERLGEAPGRAVARSLWGYRWPLPELPEGPGDLRCIAVESSIAALRLAAGVVAEVRRRGQTARLVPAERDAASWPGHDACSMVVVVGDLGVRVMEGVESWVAATGGSAVVLGAFPPGWDPPGPWRPETSGDDGLVTVGPVREAADRDARRWQAARFNPANRADRRALTDACVRRSLGEASGEFVLEAMRAGRIEAAAALVPEGVPESFLTECAGATARDLVRAVSEDRLVVDGDLWRLPHPPRLRPDPRHRQAAELFAPRDPRRLLHRFLGGGDRAPLLEWVRTALDDLRSADVVRLLDPLDPVTLDQGLAELHVEALLAQAEPGAARRVLRAVQQDRRRPFECWLACLDAGPDSAVSLAEARDLAATHPRAAAECAIAAARPAEDRAAAGACLKRAVRRLGGSLARWYEVERTALVQPGRLENPVWRRQAAAGHPAIRRRIAHLRALRRVKSGRRMSARRVYRRLLDAGEGPGRRGLLHIDLAAASDEDPDQEAALLLRALRLLEAAGFKNRSYRVTFNLGMLDLEQWRLNRAEQRITGAGGAEDPDGMAALALLDLARGRLNAVARRLERADLAGVPDRLTPEWRRIRGLLALFEGRPVQARELLANSCAEGRRWIPVLEVLEGGHAGVVEDPPDWPVSEIVALLEGAAGRIHPPAPAWTGAPTVAEAVAVVVARTLRGWAGWPGPHHRSQVLQRLHEAGADGWARSLTPVAQIADDEFSRAMARLAEAASLDALDRPAWELILTSFGLTGLELRSADGRRVLWGVGDGTPGPLLSLGGRQLVALGGEPSSTGRWRLLVAILDQCAPEDAPRVRPHVGAAGLVGRCEAMTRLKEELGRVAPLGVPVLITGETGTGKELVARALHQLSGRTGRMVAVNVAEVAGSLFESELFGAVKGAYTGAEQSRPGLIEAAEGGTLFLDEIGELELPYQAKFLRILENFEVRRLGSDETRRVDVRLVIATNRDLERMVADGTFREDLYYRIRSAPILLPPLRERGEDILLLRDVLMERAVSDQGLRRARWTPEADRALLEHGWPGNVRELRRAVEAALVQADGGRVTPATLPFEPSPASRGPVRRWDEAIDALRRDLIRDALEASGGNRSAAARALGLTRQTLLYHMKNLGIR